MEIRLEKNFTGATNKCIQGEIEAIIKSVFSLSPQGFYKSVKMLMTNPVSLCVGKKRLALCNRTPAVSRGKTLGGALGEEVLARGFTVQRDRLLQKQSSTIVRESFHFMNKRLTAYSDSLVLILSAPASLPFTNQRQNVIPASKTHRPEGQGLCAPTKICATLTDIQKIQKKKGGKKDEDCV